MPPTGITTWSASCVSPLPSLGERLREFEDRVKSLERETPSAQRLQYEADVTMADFRASGWSEYDDPAYPEDDEDGVS